MKGSGCVRVTASGAFATIGSADATGAGRTQLSIRRSATMFVETMFVETMFVERTGHVFDEHGNCGDEKLCRGQWG